MLSSIPVQVLSVLFEICQNLMILSGFPWLRVPARWILSQPAGGDRAVVILIWQHQSLSSYCIIKWQIISKFKQDFWNTICFAKINGENMQMDRQLDIGTRLYEGIPWSSASSKSHWTVWNWEGRGTWKTLSKHFLSLLRRTWHSCQSSRQNWKTGQSRGLLSLSPSWK